MDKLATQSLEKGRRGFNQVTRNPIKYKKFAKTN